MQEGAGLVRTVLGNVNTGPIRKRARQVAKKPWFILLFHKIPTSCHLKCTELLFEQLINLASEAGRPRPSQNSTWRFFMSRNSIVRMLKLLRSTGMAHAAVLLALLGRR
jgi:hypothetical protein